MHNNEGEETPHKNTMPIRNSLSNWTKFELNSQIMRWVACQIQSSKQEESDGAELAVVEAKQLAILLLSASMKAAVRKVGLFLQWRFQHHKLWHHNLLQQHTKQRIKLESASLLEIVHPILSKDSQSDMVSKLTFGGTSVLMAVHAMNRTLTRGGGRGS